MQRTRFSLFYLASYLLGGGALFLSAPVLALKFFLSTGAYDPVMVRLLGVMFISLGMIVVAIIRFRVEALYPVTLMVRVFILLSLCVFYAATRDPLFIVLLAIVGLGFTLTLLSYLSDSKSSDVRK